MFEVVQSFWAPKTSGYEQEYEDAADWNPERGVAAIADGVSSAIFSRAWADILTAAVVTDPPTDPSVVGSLTAWLAPHRQTWSERIELPKLKWNQVAKLNQIGGGWVTLLWLQLVERPVTENCAEINGEQDNRPDQTPELTADDSAIVEGQRAAEAYQTTSWSMTCHAIGDCNVFVVRNGQLQFSHPMQSSSAYAQKPQAVCSMNRGQDGQLSVQTKTFDCESGDTLVLCTDAVGQWLWSELEQHNGEVDWQRLSNLTVEEWHFEVERLRGESRMPIDDCTLIILRVGPRVLATPLSTESQGDVVAMPDDHIETEIEPAAVMNEPAVADAAETGPMVESSESLENDAGNDTIDMPAVEDTPLVVEAAINEKHPEV